MTDRELVVLTTGGLLLASGIRRAEETVARSVRGDVLRRVDAVAHGWHRRLGNASASLCFLVGGLVVLRQLRAYRRQSTLASRGDVAELSSQRDDAAEGPAP